MAGRVARRDRHTPRVQPVSDAVQFRVAAGHDAAPLQADAGQPADPDAADAQEMDPQAGPDRGQRDGIAHRANSTGLSESAGALRRPDGVSSASRRIASLNRKYPSS